MGEEEVTPGRGRRRAPGLALAAAGMACGAAYTVGAFRYPAGSAEAPGPGLFPLAVGVLLIWSSVAALIAAWRRPGAGPEPLGPFAWRVPVVLLALPVSAWLLGTAGFLVAGTVLGAVVLSVEHKRPAWVVILAAAAISTVIALTFRLLGVPLPGMPL